MDASESKSGGEKEKEKEIHNDFENRKPIWLEEKMKMFQKAFPMIQEDARLCKLIAAQHEAEEHYRAWLHKHSANDSAVDDDESVQRGPVLGQENSPDIATQQSQEMEQDGTINAEEANAGIK